MNTVSVSQVMGRVGTIIRHLNEAREEDALDEAVKLYSALEWIAESRQRDPSTKPRRRKSKRRKG